MSVSEEQVSESFLHSLDSDEHSPVDYDEASHGYRSICTHIKCVRHDLLGLLGRTKSKNYRYTMPYPMMKTCLQLQRHGGYDLKVMNSKANKKH